MFANHKLLASAALLVAITMAAPALADVLIYTDSTPGSVIHAEAAVRVAQQRGEDVRVVTNAKALENELMWPGWSYVVVVVEYASEAPVYADALVDYLQYGSRVEFRMWRADTHIAPNVGAVVAPLGLAVWSHERTTLGYVGRRVHEPRILDGYWFPDFREVRLFEPIPLPTLDETSEVDDCKADCVLQFMVDMDICNDEYQHRLGDCNDLYDPGSVQWIECAGAARKIRDGCEMGAAFDLMNCAIRCTITVEPDGPKAPAPGPAIPRDDDWQ